MPDKEKASKSKKDPFRSPFQTADKLLKEDKALSENERRFEKWMDMMIRERRLEPSWKEDEEAENRIRSIKDRDYRPEEPLKKGKRKNTGLDLEK
jgi:hypothetical protein